MSNDPNVDPQHEPAEQSRPGRKWTAGVVALALVFVALASYDLISGGVGPAAHPAASQTAAEAAPRATAAALAGSASPAPSPSITSSPAASKTSSPSASPAASKISSPAPSDAAGLLTVADAAAYGPDGTSDGDHPQLAPGIINGDGQAWYTSWYASAEFGNLQSGTGLLLDMGETVTVSSLRLVLGAPVGADVQVRVGNTPLLAELPVAASASDVGGTVRLPVTTPASGRYVLIWFTQLPLESTGKYQVSVYSATVYGAKRTLFAALGATSSGKRDAIRSYSITIQS